MQSIKKDELFKNLGGFLKSKGIELSEGPYSARIQRGCNLVSEAINATQTRVKKTKVQVDQALDQLRQTIHENTAPAAAPESKKPKPTKSRAKRPSASAPKATASASKSKAKKKA